MLLGCLLPAVARADQGAVPCPDGPAAAGVARLLVTATGVRRVAGNITFTLYGAVSARFLAHRGSIAITRVELTGLSATTCLQLSAPGTYAIAIYHDANGNHRFDRTLLGLPAEGYGFSNNAPALVGLPNFASVKFNAPPGTTALTIRLRY